VPEDRFDYRPHEKSWTLGKLAGHVAEGGAFAATVMEPELDFAAAGGEWQPFEPTTKAEVLAKLDEVGAIVAGSLAGRDDAFMTKTWTKRAGPKVIWEARRDQAFRTMAIHHTIHHRGQLEVYMRMVGAKLPPIYGPTADVPDMF